MTIIDQNFNKFFNSTIDEIDCYNFCDYFHQSEFLFKEKFIINAPQKITAQKHNLIINNLKKLKDPDAKYFIKYLYYQIMIKRHILNLNIFDDTFFNLLLSDKDFEKNFYHVIGEIDSKNIFSLLKEIASKKNITFLESLKDAFIGNASNYSSKFSSVKKDNLNCLDLFIRSLPMDEVSQFYLLLLDCDKNNYYPLHRLDRILFESSSSFSDDEALKHLMFFVTYKQEIFNQIFKKCENFSFFQEMQLTNLFALIIEQNLLDLINKIYLLCKVHKDSYYTETCLAKVLPKKTILLALIEIGNQISIDRFIKNNSHLDEIKKLLIYS